MMNLTVVYSGPVLGARRVYRDETVETALLGYIQKHISEVTVKMERSRWRRYVKGEKKTRYWCQALCVIGGGKREVENV